MADPIWTERWSREEPPRSAWWYYDEHREQQPTILGKAVAMIAIGGVIAAQLAWIACRISEKVRR